MNTPPFRLSATSDLSAGSRAGSYRPVDACCDDAAEVRHEAARRGGLADLSSHFHCSVIGTCLGTAVLRKLVPRHADVDRTRASDLEIHHAAVELAGRGGEGAKALQKALNDQHAATLRRFAAAADEAALEALWREAMRQGEIPGAYWALLTHPRADPRLRQLAFGDVHMLSHLVGAANRADIRRLVALERENAELRERAERLQARQHETAAEHEQERESLHARLRELGAEAVQARSAAQAGAECDELRATLEARERQVALHAERRDRAEQALAATESRAEELEHILERNGAAMQAMQEELRALEQAYAGHCSPPGEGAQPLEAVLRGRRLVYVGGRPGSNAALRDLVRAAGGEIVVHDGGLEDRKGLLAAAIQGADLVLFPVDCVDHDSAGTVKRLCARTGVPFAALRSASVSSFVAALLPPAAATPGQAPPSRFCLRSA